MHTAHFAPFQMVRQSHRRLRVVRLETTTDSQRIVGLLIPNSAIESVMQVTTLLLPDFLFIFLPDLSWVADVEG
ncbi:hypothetical protein C4D60_Mb08t16650 [Musa balbisiana]|uniref:Uncharacterized protein n=1 Tax=Musa balbisiana TaxID=52838 RepID=A0A4S8K4A8_MUSBA|nr:hypothetical protein C4D60_Mb08t16650 [Musa balbisiana]